MSKNFAVQKYKQENRKNFGFGKEIKKFTQTKR